MSWKDLPIWVKNGIIGILFWILIINPLTYISYLFLNEKICFLLNGASAILIIGVKEGFCTPFIGWLLYIIIGIPFNFFIGALIGEILIKVRPIIFGER